MKNMTKIWTHMITWGMALLLAQVAVDDAIQLLIFAIGNALLAGICFWLRLKVKQIGMYLFCRDSIRKRYFCFSIRADDTLVAYPPNSSGSSVAGEPKWHLCRCDGGHLCDSLDL